MVYVLIATPSRAIPLQKAVLPHAFSLSLSITRSPLLFRGSTTRRRAPIITASGRIPACIASRGWACGTLVPIALACAAWGGGDVPVVSGDGLCGPLLESGVRLLL